jgi:hypothetical protein
MLSQAPVLIAGITVSGGGKTTVVEGSGGLVTYAIKNTGANAIELVGTLPALADFKLSTPVNGDATDVPKLTGTIGLNRDGITIQPGSSVDFSIQFTTDKDPPEKGPNGNGGTDPDFGQVDLLLAGSGLLFIAKFADTVTGDDYFFDSSNYPATSIKVIDQGLPEPSALTLLVIGIFGLMGYRWRPWGRQRGAATSH